MEQNSIVVKNVTKKFDDFMLDHISFTVPTEIGRALWRINFSYWAKWCWKKYNYQFNFRPVKVGCG